MDSMPEFDDQDAKHAYWLTIPVVGHILIDEERPEYDEVWQFMGPFLETYRMTVDDYFMLKLPVWAALAQWLFDSGVVQRKDDDDGVE